MTVATQAVDASSVVSRPLDEWSPASTLGTLPPSKFPLAPMSSTDTRPATRQGTNRFTISIRLLREPKLTESKTDTHPYRFRGEPFELEIDDGIFSLRHPRWSLMGTGKTLLETETDLLDEAREVAHAMLELPIKTLSFEAFRLREFLLRII